MAKSCAALPACVLDPSSKLDRCCAGHAHRDVRAAARPSLLVWSHDTLASRLPRQRFPRRFALRRSRPVVPHVKHCRHTKLKYCAGGATRCPPCRTSMPCQRTRAWCASRRQRCTSSPCVCAHVRARVRACDVPPRQRQHRLRLEVEAAERDELAELGAAARADNGKHLVLLAHSAPVVRVIREVREPVALVQLVRASKSAAGARKQDFQTVPVGAQCERVGARLYKITYRVTCGG